MFGLKLGLKFGLPWRSTSKTPAPTAGPRLSPVASAVVLAAGAGVAFWWWTQWARGRAESEADLALSEAADTNADLPKAAE